MTTWIKFKKAVVGLVLVLRWTGEGGMKLSIIKSLTTEVLLYRGPGHLSVTLGASNSLARGGWEGCEEWRSTLKMELWRRSSASFTAQAFSKFISGTRVLPFAASRASKVCWKMRLTTKGLQWKPPVGVVGRGRWDEEARKTMMEQMEMDKCGLILKKKTKEKKRKRNEIERV